jgi:hypothetical protein
MGLDLTWRRRWLGIASLASALGMLVIGLTVLSGRLDGLTFVVYWLLCLLFTGAAMLIAVRDARALTERTRAEQRALLETTLKDIETDARSRRKPARKVQRPG